MSQILVSYFSRTGNTKKVAEAIYTALDGAKVIKPLSEAGPLEPYGLLLIGFPVHSHSVPFPVEIFLKKIPPGKPVALFCTHGALPGHRLAREALEYASILAGRGRLLGTFRCRGKLSLQALDVLGRSPEHKEWAEMSASAASHPDAHDLAEAGAFAGDMKARSASSKS